MKISKWTIVRTIMIILVIVNMLLKAFGINTINVNENAVLGVVEALVEIGAVVCAWWYNNSFTEKARKADLFFKTLKESDSDVQTGA